VSIEPHVTVCGPVGGNERSPVVTPSPKLTDPDGRLVLPHRTTSPSTVNSRVAARWDVVEAAHDVGLTDADLLQILAECVFAGLVGMIDNLAGRVPLDEFLRPRLWKPG
jgi:hypothetical protein